VAWTEGRSLTQWIFVMTMSIIRPIGAGGRTRKKTWNETGLSPCVASRRPARHRRSRRRPRLISPTGVQCAQAAERHSGDRVSASPDSGTCAFSR
jgi:hypothetical protein